MPSVAETITIPAPPDEVWPLLSDPATVASCIPGATLSPDQDGGDVWKGQIRVKFGPTVAIFRGEATLTYDHENRTCTIEGRGIDNRGASRALANGRVVATGSTETTLAVEGDYNVSGPLETFANAGGVHVARALLGEFAKNMGALVEQRRGEAGSAADATTPTPEPVADAPSQRDQPLAAAAAAPATTSDGATARAAASATPAPVDVARPTPAAQASTGPCYVIADTRVRDEAAFARYREHATSSVAAHGGRYLVRGGASRDLEGSWAPERVIVIEFPSRAAAEGWYASADYARAKEHAGAAFTRNLLLVDGLPSAAARQASTTPAAATSPRPRPAQAAELSATTLLWAAFKSWISSLYGKRS